MTISYLGNNNNEYTFNSGKMITLSEEEMFEFFEFYDYNDKIEDLKREYAIELDLNHERISELEYEIEVLEEEIDALRSNLV